MHVLVNGASSSVEVWLDGTRSSTATDSLGTAPTGRWSSAIPRAARTFDVAFDNVVADPRFIADVAAPTAPSNLHATAVTANEVDLAWDAATDDVGVTGYRVYRNGLALADVDGATSPTPTRWSRTQPRTRTSWRRWTPCSHESNVERGGTPT